MNGVLSKSSSDSTADSDLDITKDLFDSWTSDCVIVDGSPVQILQPLPSSSSGTSINFHKSSKPSFLCSNSDACNTFSAFRSNPELDKLGCLILLVHIILPIERTS